MFNKRNPTTCKSCLGQAWQALPDGPYCRLQTIKGIGLQTAAALVAKIVSIDCFPTASSLIGYFGVFPEEVDVSGTDRHGKPKQGAEIHMSRKGNDLVRWFLYKAAQCAAKWNPPVKALFARLMANSKDYNVAIGHCMAKLLRQVFALWKKDCDFDPQFETRQQAEPAAESAPEPTPKSDTVESGVVEEKKTVVGHRKAVEPQGKAVTTTAFSIPLRADFEPTPNMKKRNEKTASSRSTLLSFNVTSHAVSAAAAAFHRPRLRREDPRTFEPIP